MRQRKVEKRARLSAQGVDWCMAAWVQCNVCEAWWDMKCARVDEGNITETRFVCAVNIVAS